MPIPIGAALIGSALIGAAGSAMQPGPEKQASGNLHLVNPQQQALYQKMYAGLQGGGGDFGYGTNVRQGTSQLQNMMAQRGIKVGTGGAYSGAYGNMVGAAASADQEARRNYAMQLLGQQLQTANVTGANLIPGSPSNSQDRFASYMPQMRSAYSQRFSGGV